MKTDLVTFDCAQTLVEVKWQVGQFAVDCAQYAGLDLGEEAALRYAQMFRDRHSVYLGLNLTRDAFRCDAFWQDLTRDWLLSLDLDPDVWHTRIDEASKEIGFGPNSKVFKVYQDVAPCLDELSSRGIKTAVISNWDYSLHNILRLMGIHDRFDLVIASLEEGMEKPDPRLFHLVLDRLQVDPANALHVGDDPMDDLQGARNVGMRALLIDRAITSPAPPYISSLDQLVGALNWKS